MIAPTNNTVPAEPGTIRVSLAAAETRVATMFAPLASRQHISGRSLRSSSPPNATASRATASPASQDCVLAACREDSGRGDARGHPPAPGLVHAEAGDNFPHLAIEQGTVPMLAAARDNGIAMLTVAHSYHCGVLGYHTERMAVEGFVVLGFTHAPAAIAPWGAKQPVIGTNPFSCAVPRAGAAPLVIDQSSSVVAKSEVVDHHSRDAPIPAHWAFDSRGEPTTSAAAALLGGTMAPSGGYKGFGIGLMVEILSALLSGANPGLTAPALALADAKTPPPGVGQCFIAIDAAAAPASFPASLAAILTAIDAQDGARIPGDRRLAHRATALRDGLVLPATYL